MGPACPRIHQTPTDYPHILTYGRLPTSRTYCPIWAVARLNLDRSSLRGDTVGWRLHMRVWWSLAAVSVFLAAGDLSPG